MNKALIIFGVVVATGVTLGVVFSRNMQQLFFSQNTSRSPIGVSTQDIPEEVEEQPTIQVVAENLSVPWDLVFLPDGDMLVTERVGRVVRVGSDTQVSQQIEGVADLGEGGLLGIVLHPQFTANYWVYLYFTTQTTSGLENRVVRYEYDGSKLVNGQAIITGIPASQNHDGGKMAFGPDGYLYVSTGDASNPQLAQDTTSLAGKILRLTADGQPAPENPFQNEVYSYGHRNPQGIAWDDRQKLWSTEHGPSGFQTGNDELNLIVAGGNYGWPTIKGQQTQEGMITPVIESGKSETWAPAAAAYYQGSIFFTGLRGESLYQAKIDGDQQVSDVQAHLKGEFGRLRALKIGPDGYFYISTSNTDGRGDENKGDDKIIKINPQIFF